MLFAIVDIETTGSYAMGNGITEVAIVIHDGREQLHSYETLINPGRSIPRFIQSLTGITDEMLVHAPSFGEVAGQIYELLRDKVFVAHNVNFDFSFLRHHLEGCGFVLDARKLCTVRLARKILPGLPSYSLGKLCHHLEIDHQDQHRAGGDARATALLFTLLGSLDHSGNMAAMLKGRNKEQYLPPNVPVDQVDSLPETPGVYYFYNAAGKIIYVGKALNLNQRVKSHFANNRAGRQKQDFMREIFRISFEPTATDLMAQILESVEIRRLWPLYNRSQKGYQPLFGLFVYEDREGYQRLALDKMKQCFRPLHTFNTLAEGHQWLRQLIAEFGLCPRLCHLAPNADCSNGAPAEGCTGTCAAEEGVTSYNERVGAASAWVSRMLPSFALLDHGRQEGEQSCILVEQGVFTAMGYLDGDTDCSDPVSLKQKLTPYPDNDFIRNLIFRHASDHPGKCIRWEAELFKSY